MRREGDVFIAAEIDGGYIGAEIGPSDRDLCDEAKVAGGLGNDANLVRSALYHFCVHMLGYGRVTTNNFRLRTNHERGEAVKPMRKHA